MDTDEMEDKKMCILREIMMTSNESVSRKVPAKGSIINKISYHLATFFVHVILGQKEKITDKLIKWLSTGKDK